MWGDTIQTVRFKKCPLGADIVLNTIIINACNNKIALHLFIYNLFIYLSFIYLFIHLFIYSFIHLFIHLLIYLLFIYGGAWVKIPSGTRIFSESLLAFNSMYLFFHFQNNLARQI